MTKRECGWYRVTHKDVIKWHILFYSAYQDKWLYGAEWVEFDDLEVDRMVMTPSGQIVHNQPAHDPMYNTSQEG